MNENIEYLNSLSNMSENQFSEKILVRLFSKMGYDRVDFSGGVLEQGRDIILQKIIPLEKEPHITIIQVKKINKKQKIEDSTKIAKLTHQIYEAIDAGAINVDGRKITPNTIILAFPEQAHDRFLNQIKPLMNISNSKNIKTIVFDGPQVLDSIKIYAPELLESLVNKNERIYDTSDAEDSNEELSVAVNSFTRKSIQDIYMSLDFFVGSIESNFLLTSQINFIKNQIIIDQSNLPAFKKQYYEIERKFNIRISTQTPEEIVSEFNEKNKKYQSEENLENIKYAEFLHSEKGRIKSSISESQAKLKKYAQQLKSEDKLIKQEIINLISFLEMNGTDIEIEIIPKTSIQNDYSEEIISKIIELKNINAQILKTKITYQPKMVATISTDYIISKINSYKSKYVELSSSIEKNLKNFLVLAEESLSFLQEITSESSILYEIIEITINGSEKERIEIKPESVLSSGYDIAVYGAAGAGKTTTLSNFAIKKSRSEKNSVIYVPLNRVVEKYSKIYRSAFLKNEKERTPEDDLIIEHNNSIFLCILLSKDINFNSQTLELIKKEITQDKTVIIDGLDEAYDSIAGILHSINNFKRSYKCQIVISSRDCVKYLDDIDFLGITLLPFNKEQLKTFVNKWFGNDSKKQGLIEKIENTDLYREISSPLLATITCDLVEKGFTIPTCEHEIYEQRFSLLTGEYDKSKGITRQKFPRKTLTQAAIALAFEMHIRKVRELDQTECVRIIKQKLQLDSKGVLSSELFEELISPCNIIYFDKLSKKYSFGHFRFQEYLVSEQISTDRNINVLDLISQTWWAGALCLFAQKTDITFIFEQIIYASGEIPRSNNILKQMIKSSPKDKRTGLYDLFRLTESTKSTHRIIDYREHSNLDISEFGIYTPFNSDKYNSDNYF